MKCFYHSADFDGKASAAIVKHFNPECELIPAYYGMDMDHIWSKVGPDEVIYMVDFCFQPYEDMIRLANSCQKLIWIDHHISAIKEHDKLWKATGFKIAGIRNTEEAACELTWKYFSTKPIPETIKLLGRYDMWDFGYSINVLPFQYGMRGLNPHPEDPIWRKLGLNYLDIDLYSKLVEDGIAILRYVGQDYESYMRRCAFITEFEEYRALAVNRGFTSSKIFERFFDPTKHDIMLSFCFTSDRTWRIGIYTDKDEIDVSELAKIYGGGGHAKAAGFQCRRLPFLLCKLPILEES